MKPRSDYGEWLALGLDVMLTDPADRERIERDRRGLYRPTWRLATDPSKEDSEAPLVILAPAERSPCPRCRAVVHPVRADSPFWGSLGEDADMILVVGGGVAGAAKVNWIATIGRGLVDGQLREFIRWSNNGRLPSL